MAKYSEDCGRLGDALRGTKQRSAAQVKSTPTNKSIGAKRPAKDEEFSKQERQRGTMWP